jgi:hypothetical protein
MKMKLSDMLDIMRNRLSELYKFEGFATLGHKYEYTGLVKDIDELLNEVKDYFGVTDEDIRKEMDGKTD